MSHPNLLLWLDLETTGLTLEDSIVEVGCVLTTRSAPWAEITSYSAVVRPPGEWEAALPDAVAEMHTATGLLDDVRVSDYTIEQAERDIIEMLRNHGTPGEFILAGSGIGHFDDWMIRAKMPDLDGWLHYKHFDVSSVREGLYMAGRRSLVASGSTFGPTAKAHRALDDIRDHLAEWRVYGELFASLPTPPVAEG